MDVTKQKVKVGCSISFILHSMCKQSQLFFGCAEQFSCEIEIKSKSMLNATNISNIVLCYYYYLFLTSTLIVLTTMMMIEDD